jgi:hypothetical protein
MTVLTRPVLGGISRRGSLASRLTAETAVFGLLVGIVVVWPWTRGGYLILLDWVSGPDQAVTPGLYGLDPTALDAMPYRLATQYLRDVVGSQATAWLLIMLYFPIAAAGASALAGGGRWRRYTTAGLMVCNPFVVERIRAGHVSFLLSVALLTWLISSTVHARRMEKTFAARPAGWYALTMVVGPHGAFLGGAALLAVMLLPKPRWIDVRRTAMTLAAAGAVYLYAVAVVLNRVPTMKVTELDLDAYATRAGPGGLLVTVASLHGFWRGGADLPRDYLNPALGVCLLLAVIAAVIVGVVLLWRRDPNLGAPLAVLIPVSLVLGAGIDGPAGSLYRLAFRYVPLFEVMREQQKWVALAVIGYAVAVGGAVEGLVYLAHRHNHWAPRLAATYGVLAAWLAVAAVAPALLWGLGGTVSVSKYPEAWYQADREMGDGPGAVLFLPWHGYQPFSFTDGRTVATPAAAFFRRPVLSSDAVELGALRTNSTSRRMAYMDRLIASGGAGVHFGRLLAPLGVEYVILARDRDPAPYGWVERQTDLKPVLRTETLDLYRVDAVGTGRVVSSRTGGFDESVALAGADQLGTEAMIPGGIAEGPVPAKAAGQLRRVSSTRYVVEPGEAGWAVIPEEWSPGWQFGGGPGKPTAAGTIAVYLGAGEAVVEYKPWRWLRYGLAASLLSFLALVLGGLVEHRRELSAWWARRASRPEPELRRNTLSR